MRGARQPIPAQQQRCAWQHQTGAACTDSDAKCCSYDRSDLKQSNQRQLEKFLQTDGRAISKRTLQQLQTKRATTTGFFRATWILFKYRGRADFTDPAFLVSGVVPSLFLQMVADACQQQTVLCHVLSSFLSQTFVSRKALLTSRRFVTSMPLMKLPSSHMPGHLMSHCGHQPVGAAVLAGPARSSCHPLTHPYSKAVSCCCRAPD